MKQSTDDAKEGEMPVVMHRKNRHEWLVTMTLTDWMKLYKAYENETAETKDLPFT